MALNLNSPVMASTIKSISLLSTVLSTAVFALPVPTPQSFSGSLGDFAASVGPG